MIPKRQNHTLPNLIAAACELMVAAFSAFRDVTEYAVKFAIMHFGCVTIKMRQNGYRSLSRFGK
jgi:hypothetical protein